MYMEIVYCDNCGDIVHQTSSTPSHSPLRRGPLVGKMKDHEDFSELPWDVESANAGESGTICLECIIRLNAKQVEESEERQD